MALLQKSEEYSLLGPDDSSEISIKRSDGFPKRRRQLSPGKFFLYFCVGICFLALGIIIGVIIKSYDLFQSNTRSSAESALVCINPPTRREWRSLSTAEKHSYLNAVGCLRETPSRLGLNQSLYDDFPWVHSRIGEYSHHAAAFLAWHRYFIHTYERALREECHYQGHLTYWNWVLDWEDITRAPIWQDNDGFGSNGDPDVGEEMLGGHCVVDGPFARLEVLYIDERLTPHCLSRGFESGEELAEHGTWFRPEVMEKLQRGDDYESFNLGLEDGPHIAIPRSIRGDFSMFTAPYDPVFFLHHTQLDRLWWTWQQRDMQNRKWQYRGLAAHNSTEKASLTDVIPMGGLAPDIKVSEIIDTESDLLCYIY